jgi:hypothetical protein
MIAASRRSTALLATNTPRGLASHYDNLWLQGLNSAILSIVNRTFSSFELENRSKQILNRDACRIRCRLIVASVSISLEAWIFPREPFAGIGVDERA